MKRAVQLAGLRAGPSASLHVKTTPPVAARNLLRRAFIRDRFVSATNAKVVLVRGPAGFGKTSVMRQLWDEHSGNIDCAWITLDESDNDASRLISSLAVALEPVLGSGDANGGWLKDSSPKSSQLAMTLLESVASHGRPFALFMDEFETVHNPAVLALTAQLIDRMPPGSQLIIGSRRLPDMGLARLRARGQLLEIDPSQLRFSAEEAGEFLTHHRGLSLSPEQVEKLHRRTEGWVTALWLASIALKDRRDVERFISGFAGSNADIADYLAEDVFNGQPEEVRTFLLMTSILSQLTPDLCDAVCQRTDSAALLQQIEKANLFLVPLDEDRSTYRYHSLFAEFLKSQLKRNYPEWIPKLQRAASDWYLSQTRYVPAVAHALASDDFDYALPLLESHVGDLLDDGRLRLLTHWLDPLAPSLLPKYPTLRLIHAWAVTFTRGPREALTLIKGLKAEALQSKENVAQLLALRPLLLGITDHIEEADDLAQTNLSLVDHDSAFAFGMLAQTLANTSMILGRFADARRYAGQARAAQADRESHFQFSLADSVEGAIDLMQARLKQATLRLRVAAGASDEKLPRAGKRNAFPGVLYAEALYESGDEKRAESSLSIFAPLLRDLGLPDHLITAHVLLARILTDREEVDQALKILEELESVGHRLRLQRVIACARLERARTMITRSQLGSAKDQLEQSGDWSYWSEVSGRGYVANDVLTRGIGHARFLIRSGNADEAVPLLKGQLEEADRAQRFRRALKLRILLAEGLHCVGQHKAALRMVGRAVEVAAPEGFVSTFAEEGHTVRVLLAEYLDAEGRTHFTKAPDGEMLAAIANGGNAQPATGVQRDTLPEPLTRKEIKVLELLAKGFSNDSMAEKLFVSESTVRTHLRNINIKLGAGNRTQALVIARELELIH